MRMGNHQRNLAEGFAIQIKANIESGNNNKQISHHCSRIRKVLKGTVLMIKNIKQIKQLQKVIQAFRHLALILICNSLKKYCMKINFINQMKSNLSIILGSLFVILAVYIVGNSFLRLWRGGSTESEYNIGCCAVEHSINRSDHILAHIATLQHEENMSRIAAELQPLPLVDPPTFQNSTIQLALSFEKFVKKLTQQHDYNTENLQIYREVGRAEKEYLACKATVDLSFSEQDCTSNWREYANCSTRMDKVKLKLQRLTEEERTIRDQIAEMFKMPNASISALDLAKRIYNESMKQNEQLKTDLTVKLGPLERTHRQRNYQRDQSLQKYQLTFKNLRECQQNKKKHDACEQISKQVRNINTENIAYLKVMMQSKEQLLRNLQRILDSQKNSKEIEELNEKYLKHKEEYINMLKEFISLTRENEKACGCTPELEAELKRDLENLKNRAADLNTEIHGLDLKIEKLNHDLEKCEEEREEIVRKYKEALELNEHAPSSSESELSKVNRGIRYKYNEILELRGVYKGITSECEAIKLRLNKRVHEISVIDDCLAKKNYFLQLKRQTAQYIHSDNDELTRMLESKKELAYYLNSIGPQ